MTDRTASSRSAAALPPTVNLHLIAHCNRKCRYCYATFLEERRHRAATERHMALLPRLAEAGVTRVTFAGGEPTLMPGLPRLLARASELGLVTSVVSNGSRIDDRWFRESAPHLRWLTLSIDSVDHDTAVTLGRTRRDKRHLEHLLAVAERVRKFNALRPPARRIRLKLNITVTSLNAHEDPSEFIDRLAPEKVKLLQMLLVAGENDTARDLVCSDEAFRAYAERVRVSPETQVVVEATDDMDGSYAMIDPLGRFYQRVDGRYLRSEPIVEIGVDEAWRQVGGYDERRFVARGGAYDPGQPARGNAPYWIAIEGLDGSGKSTLVRALSELLEATVVRNPPEELTAERREADTWTPSERRRWYLNANAKAAEIAVDAQERGEVVVMDRSVASTLAFGRADEGRVAVNGDWPEWIPRPDLLVLLSLPESERLRRLTNRGGALTSEERRLLEDDAYRGAVLEGYRRLGAVSVSATGTVDDIVASVLNLMASGNRTPVP